LRIKPIIGVVPDNRDENLNVRDEDKNFWNTMHELQGLGWTIAQHGYRHEYVSVDSGILDINKFSEFSGLSFQEQLSKIQSGKRILMDLGLWEPVFMAPGHSFDHNTLAALKECNFEYVTDGFGFYPWQEDELIFVPQMFSSFNNFGFGIYTVCLHLNQLSEEQIYLIIKKIEENEGNFICFQEAISHLKKPTFLERNFISLIRILLKIKRII
jgi:predicted deacetylase